jgi:hypothetical protein
MMPLGGGLYSKQDLQPMHPTDVPASLFLRGAASLGCMEILAGLLNIGKEGCHLSCDGYCEE